MSRMTKFLKQKCVLEKAQRDENGNVVINAYGEIQYEPPITIKCRKERIVRDVELNNGAITRSNTRYFTDEKIPVDTDDKIDGQVITEVEDYANELGEIEGYESYVHRRNGY